MRYLTETYDRVFVDIDDTLIYGFWTDLMKHSWNILRNNFVSQTLMFLQSHFSLYKINQKLKFALRDLSKVTFLTVRAKSLYTRRMLAKIFNVGVEDIDLVELGTDNGPFEKAEYIAKEVYEQDLENVCLVDDSFNNREMVRNYGFDAYEPVGRNDKRCG